MRKSCKFDHHMWSRESFERSFKNWPACQTLHAGDEHNMSEVFCRLAPPKPPVMATLPDGAAAAPPARRWASCLGEVRPCATSRGPAEVPRAMTPPKASADVERPPRRTCAAGCTSSPHQTTPCTRVHPCSRLYCGLRTDVDSPHKKPPLTRFVHRGHQHRYVQRIGWPWQPTTMRCTQHGGRRNP